jgi:lipopolysaccharide assembly outer membrane protein LptD (OstA)
MSTIVRIAIFSLRNKRLHFIWLCLCPAMLLAQGYEKIVPADSLGKNFSDTSQVSEPVDSLPTSRSALESEVHYKAKDSIVFDMVNKRAYLYGDAHIDYQNLTLDADYITIDWTSNVICAAGLPDSSGKLAGTPVFKEGEQTYKSKTLCYNFKTKSGRITEMITQESEEAYYHAEVSKTVKQGNKDIIFVKNGTYTTCNLPDPHFGIFSPRMKVMPNDKVITSFAYLKVEDVPVPLVLPFGFFPANTKKTSGIIVPEIGNDGSRGFVLRNGGFYYGGSEYFDAALTGDIYTRGLYRTNIQTNYAKRYRFNGGLSFGYSRLDNHQLPETPDYAREESYNIQWRHSVNPKARPGTTFSADVNAGSSKYFKESSYEVRDILNPMLNSSVNYGKSFRVGNVPFNLSTALRHSQNVNSGAINFELPSATLSMSRITPFKSKYAIKKRWYHDLGLVGTVDMRNTLATSDTTIQNDFDIKKFNNYMTGSFPLSITIPVLKYINFTPTLTANGYLYTRKIERELDTVTNERTIVSTTQNLYGAGTLTGSTSFSTNFYGLANINQGRLLAIRHRVTPTIGFHFTPNLAKSAYGEIQADTFGTKTTPYFLYDNGIAPAPPQSKSALLSFDLNNNFEMKVRPKGGDTTKPIKKVKLLDRFSISTNYNLLADSMRLLPITFTLGTTLFDKLNVNAGSTLNPYVIDSKGRIHKEYEWDENRRLGRITSAYANFSIGLNGKPATSSGPLMYIHNPYTGFYYNRPYANFNVPWNISLNYDIRYNKPGLEKRIDKSGGVTGQFILTKNWKLSGGTQYNFTTKEFSVPVVDIYRDLHCWEMSMHWIPFGRYQSYFFNIRIKAAALRDLKLDKRDDWTETEEE